VWSVGGSSGAAPALSGVRMGYGFSAAGDTNIQQGIYVLYGVVK
jgi:hypothetical protein